MKVSVSFKNLEHTPSLDERINEKSYRIFKYLGGNISIKWTCHVSNNQHHAEVLVYGPRFEYHAEAACDSLYKSLDVAIERIEKQIHKRKDKWKNHIHQKRGQLVILDPQEAWGLHDDDAFDDVA